MTDNYIPYGPEWEKELMKTPKKFLIDMIRNIKSPDQPNQGEKEASWRKIIELVREDLYNLTNIRNMIEKYSESFTITRK